MKSLFILFSLFALSLSNTKVVPPMKLVDIFSGIKEKINQCISTSTEASESLKQLAQKNLESKDNLPLNFNTIDLTNQDREIIRKCRRDAFRATTRRPNNQVTPISLENLVHKKKFNLIKNNFNQPRKLGIVSDIQRFTAFNISGIFTCIEEAQPAIKALRNTVIFWRNKDYTSSVINVYDNFKTIVDGFTVCINAIFPPE
jgi:hypothetical protein